MECIGPWFALEKLENNALLLLPPPPIPAITVGSHPYTFPRKCARVHRDPHKSVDSWCTDDSSVVTYCESDDWCGHLGGEVAMICHPGGGMLLSRMFEVTRGSSDYVV